jgi:hypothetical protein
MLQTTIANQLSITPFQLINASLSEESITPIGGASPFWMYSNRKRLSLRLS